MSKLIVLTDLGTFKAFALSDDRLTSSPHLQPVEAFEMEEGDDRLANKVSDQAGQFRRGAVIYAANNIQANGERHNIWLENEKRSVKKIADKISSLLSNGKFDECYLAASSEINNTILEHLSAQARAKIQKNLHCNLVNAQREEILQRFRNGTKA